MSEGFSFAHRLPSRVVDVSEERAKVCSWMMKRRREKSHQWKKPLHLGLYETKHGINVQNSL